MMNKNFDLVDQSFKEHLDRIDYKSVERKD